MELLCSDCGKKMSVVRFEYECECGGLFEVVSSEFFEPNYKGPFLADSEVAKKIIQEADDSPGPHFIFANTMQNHAPYSPGKFAINPIKVSGDISKLSKETLEAYASGAHDADLMLKTLVDHFNKTKEPTIILFFGDHLPSLGNNYAVYKDAKYITGTDDPDFQNKMYRTPFVIWNNYLPEKHEELYMTPAFLGPYVLNLAQKEGTYYTDFLYDLSLRMPILPPRNEYEYMHINEEDIKNYQMLEYDVLFGKQYGYGDIKNQIVDANYTLGYGDMKINSSEWNEKDGVVTLHLNGNNFAPSAVIYLNGKAVGKTLWDNYGSLRVQLNKSAYRNNKTVSVQVKIIDSKKITIKESNALEISIQ